MTDAAGLRATGALHCNLNVRTLADASGLYEALGLRVKMRSRAEGQDATAMGLGDATDSEAWFLYDRRGGRGAPAVELVDGWGLPARGVISGKSMRDKRLRNPRLRLPAIAVPLAVSGHGQRPRAPFLGRPNLRRGW